MCPEMLSKSGHGLAIDYYSLGALLFEMLTGLPPHYSRNRQQMYNRILNEPVTVPSYVSAAAASLLLGLLRKSPKERLGARGMAEIKQHPFLSDVSWDDLYRRKVTPPNPLDYRDSHFDPEYTSMRVTWNEGEDDDDSRMRSQSLIEYYLAPSVEKPALSKQSGYCLPTGSSFKKKGTMCPGTDEKSGRGFRKEQQDNREASKAGDKNWRTCYELFAGYPFTRDTKKRQSPEGKKKCLTKSNTVSNEEDKVSPPRGSALATDSKKTLLIKAVSLRGESNDSDISITDSDNCPEVEENMEFRPLKRLAEGSPSQRCISSVNVIRATAGTRAGQPKSPLIKPRACGKSGKFVHGLAQELALYETCKLIKEEQSRANANLIKLNDDLNGIVSERKRGLPRKPSSPKRSTTNRTQPGPASAPAAAPVPVKKLGANPKTSASRPKTKMQIQTPVLQSKVRTHDSSTGLKCDMEPGKPFTAQNERNRALMGFLRRSSTNSSSQVPAESVQSRTMRKAKVAQKMSSYQSTSAAGASKDLDFTKSSSSGQSSAKIIPV